VRGADASSLLFVGAVLLGVSAASAQDADAGPLPPPSSDSRPPTDAQGGNAPAPSAPAHAADQDYETVEVHGTGWSSPRGLGDVRIKRELLLASPRQQTSEMLSAAPGFFVDHEDGEGLGNDVYLRGFDLDHGSGIEMRLGSIPINIPTHIQGQGYADANFIIPEVVRSIRVLQGTYDPRQGDAAIVGSANFDLGVAERGYQLKTTYGSFNQARVVGIAAPRDADEETFAAFSLRNTNGFGENRAGQSASLMGQVGFDVGARDHVRLLATAYGARAALPGVVRQDDVDAGRIGYYDSYPYFAGGQGVQSTRVILGADVDHVEPSGALFEFAPWFMATNFRARQNFTGDLESAQINPMIFGLGDLYETTNRENAAGLSSRFRAAPLRVGNVLEVAAEPGVYLRAGHTDQTKSLLDPINLQAWDRRIDATLDTLDVGAYADVDLRLWKRFRVSGGPRVDFLAESIDDHLANVVPAGSAPPGALPGALRDVAGVAVGPRVTGEVEIAPGFSPVVSYGEGFRSLDAERLPQGTSQPYSRVRSVEAGLRAQAHRERYTSTLAVFETWVGNELVFDAQAGGLQTENASVRRGVIGSLLAKPCSWLLASTALSITNAVFTTLVPGVSHYVPNVPPILFRADLTARGTLTRIAGKPLNGRVGVGYTFLSGRHLTDAVIGPTTHALNAGAGVRYAWIELGVDAYNLLGLRYADDAEVYVSNWSFRPGQQPASLATHLVAAPPATVLGTVSLYF
jgi:iron complex outermembrane receptor protein